jgi:EmrB/QacA subfamily drug resistance transporter
MVYPSFCYAEDMSKQQRLVLVVSVLASFVAFLDGSIVNVALPAIQRELGGGLSAQQWIVDAYLLTLGSFILIAGSLSDLLGRKRILTLGLLGFGVASLMCAVAPNSGFLVAFRALQGIAGALLVPSSLAIIISSFSGAAQGKAIGSWTAWTGISFILGPLVGGALVDQASWRWIFAINVLPIAVTLYLLRKLQVTEDIKSGAKVDFMGAALCALGLGGPVFALIEQPRYGWSDPRIYLTLALGIGLLASFLIYEKKAKNPMLPLDLFKNRNFSVGNIATLAIYAGLSAGTFLLVLFLQQVAGYTALEAGLATLPITVIMFFLSSRFGALSAKFGPRLFMGFGPLIASLGFLLMLNIDEQADYVTQVLPTILIFGLGLAVTVAPLTAAILGDVPSKQAGIASAVNNAVARVAGLVAVAAVGAVVAAQFSASLTAANGGFENLSSSEFDKIRHAPLQVRPPGLRIYGDGIIALQNASVSAFHTGVVTIAGLLVAGGVISLAGIRNPDRLPGK